MKQVTISKQSAQFFYEQCRGEYKGHMARIPNNPVLHGFCSAHDANSEVEFANFLDAISKALKGDGEAF